MVMVIWCFRPFAAMARPETSRLRTSFSASKLRIVVMPCFLKSFAWSWMMSVDWEDRPTTFTPRESVCRFTSGPTVARHLSIISNASSWQ